MEYRTPDALCGIYKIINNINGKVYVGQSINIKTRWKEHINALKRGDSGCTLLQRAWNKYGEENFSFEILELCFEDELDDIEIKYIKLYDAVNSGYNIESGGNKHKRLSIDTKQKLSNSAKERLSDPTKNPMYDKHHTDETKIKISASKKGKPLSDETKKKLSEVHMGHPGYNKNLTPVYCIELDKIFICASEAAKILGIDGTNILPCCRHDYGRKTCGGYHWEFAHTLFSEAEIQEILNNTKLIS